uniref:Uncharacterized protein n=1 Tax=Arundo donax TaxID=35708 RepID=A0A0A8XWP2_ARUDO
MLIPTPSSSSTPNAPLCCSPSIAVTSTYPSSRSSKSCICTSSQLLQLVALKHFCTHSFSSQTSS